MHQFPYMKKANTEWEEFLACHTCWWHKPVAIRFGYSLLSLSVLWRLFDPKCPSFFKHSPRDQAHAKARCLWECRLLLLVLRLSRVLKVSARAKTSGGFSQDCITFIPPGTGSNSLSPRPRPHSFAQPSQIHAQSPPLSDLPYWLQAAVARELNLIQIEATWSAADSKPTSQQHRFITSLSEGHPGKREICPCFIQLPVVSVYLSALSGPVSHSTTLWLYETWSRIRSLKQSSIWNNGRLNNQGTNLLGEYLVICDSEQVQQSLKGSVSKFFSRVWVILCTF